MWSSSGEAPGKGQRFNGSRFEWRPATATGKLTGKPARMTSPGTVGRADLIEFNQTAGTIGYIGNAVVRLELKAK